MHNKSLSFNERQSSSDKKLNKSLRLGLFFPFRCCFAGSLPFSLSTVKQTKLFHSISKIFVTFFSKKNSLSKTFSLNVCETALQFWRETHTSLWLLIGRIIFLTRQKTSFSILIGRIIFFTCENHRSLLWLARTNLRTKIYDIAFWWVFLSMYIITENPYHWSNIDTSEKHKDRGNIHGWIPRLAIKGLVYDD